MKLPQLPLLLIHPQMSIRGGSNYCHTQEFSACQHDKYVYLSIYMNIYSTLSLNLSICFSLSLSLYLSLYLSFYLHLSLHIYIYIHTSVTCAILHIRIYTYIYIYMHVYIYIERERDRDRDAHRYTNMQFWALAIHSPETSIESLLTLAYGPRVQALSQELFLVH